MNNMYGALANLLQNRFPNVANSPQGREFIRILNSGDVEAGKNMANNICQSYGVSREEAVNQSVNFFKNNKF